jgi:cytochrome oxidase Cu insertion factor (SCO1/SenC/PrrC family)
MNLETPSEMPIKNDVAQTSARPTGSALPYALCLVVVMAMAYGGWKWWEVYQFETTRGEAIPAGLIGPPLKEFELTERSGKPFKSADMRGRVWVASYFFTTCPGQCRRVNASLQVMSRMPELKDITFVSITCDPDNDHLEELRKYADLYQADPNRWLFCRADLNYTERVARGMGIALSLKGHQDRGIVIDKAGKIRKIFDATSEIECNQAKDLLLKCLAEKTPADLASSKVANGKSS